MNEYELRKTMLSCMDDKEIRSIIFNKKKERSAIRIEDYKFPILERLAELIKLPFELVCNSYLWELRSDCTSVIETMERELKSRQYKWREDSIDLNELKANINIVSIFRYYWYLPGNYRKWMNIICPFHSDRSPSMHIYENGNTFKCFWCGIWWTQIDLIMNTDKLRISEAIKKLETFL